MFDDRNATPVRGERERQVAVMHGRDLEARDAMFDFLRRLDLRPLEWSELVQHAGSASPYNGQVVESAFRVAQAVVVMFTPDDLGFLHPSLQKPDDDVRDREPSGQPRLNVVLEAGMALQSHPDKTVLVEVGSLRPISDLSGRNVVRIDGSRNPLQRVAQRLRAAGCHVNMDGEDWADTRPFEQLTAVHRLAPSDAAAGSPGGVENQTGMSSGVSAPEHDDFYAEVASVAKQTGIALSAEQLDQFVECLNSASEPMDQFTVCRALTSPKPSPGRVSRVLEELDYQGHVQSTYTDDGRKYLSRDAAGLR